MAESVLYVMGHGGRVYHFVPWASFFPGGQTAALCKFQPSKGWAWSGPQRPSTTACQKCHQYAQFYEVPGGR